MEPQLSEFHEEDCRKPYNEFRHLNQRHKPMTIAMALKCKDGVVVAADRQGTYEDMTLSEIRKVYEISPRSAVGFSWNDANWVSRFIRFVRDEPESNPDSERIESALTKYLAGRLPHEEQQTLPVPLLHTRFYGSESPHT